MSKRPLCGLALSGRPGWLVAYSLAFGFVSQTALAQAGSNSTQSQGTSTPQAQTAAQIEEVTVTAERRRQNLQKVAARVAVVTGAEILSQGKITTAQILEDVPNVTVNQALGAADNPNGNITIRGVETSLSQSGAEAPATTATYVDDVYEGIGGDFDINRVEVLYGPQGTLYGRSATGGVVAFHTTDPQLGKFGGFVSGEYGSYDLRQAIAAVNIPILPQIAVRVAAREFDQDTDFKSVVSATRTQEARVKLLYQPLSNLSFLGAWTIVEDHMRTGGYQALLSAPDTINYDGVYTVPSNTESRYHQYSLNAKYDFGYGTATYIGAYHDFDSTSDEQEAFNQIVALDQTLNPLNQIHTEEIRIASDPGSPLTYLVGANFYANLFKTVSNQYQISAEQMDGVPDTTPGTQGALVSIQALNGRIFDYGLFTEETYSILPNLRITGGARVDETKVTVNIDKTLNIDDDIYNNAITPNELVSGTLTSSQIFRNFTYKARAEYDLAPANMVYASVSTGFLPGEQQLAVVSSNASGVKFQVLPYTQEVLRAYEIGSKNRFFSNTLQVDGDLYYEHYSGYQFAINPNPTGPPGGGRVLLAIPVDIAGAELDVQWQFTPDDRISFAGGISDAEIPGNPTVAGVGPVNSFIERRLPSVIPDQFTTAYSHTIAFLDGSALVPRAQARFYGAYNVTSLTTGEIQFGEAPYVHQAATIIGDVDFDWTSANQRYSVDGYVRNIANNIYKSVITADGSGLSEIDVTPSNPRTAGVVVTAKF